MCYVRKEQLGENDKRYLGAFMQGRPAQTRVGDDTNCSDAETHVLKSSTILYKEPRQGADKFELPAGTTVLMGIDPEGRRLHHMDMDDAYWFSVMDENKKLIGWVYDQEVDNITEK